MCAKDVRVQSVGVFRSKTVELNGYIPYRLEHFETTMCIDFLRTTIVIARTS